MPKLIIYVSGRPLVQGYKLRQFKWSEVHKKYLFRATEYALEDFNKAYEEALRQEGDLNPRVMVVADVVAAVAPAPVVDHAPERRGPGRPPKRALVEVDA